MSKRDEKWKRSLFQMTLWLAQSSDQFCQRDERLSGRESRRVSRATLTGDSPSTHSAREVGWLRRHRVGECGSEPDADFTVFYLPRIPGP